MNTPENTMVLEEPAEAFEPFLNPAQMKTVFQKRIPSLLPEKAQIRDCTISYTHYKRYVKPSSRRKSFLAVCYQLEIVNQAGRPLGSHTLYAKAYLAGRSQFVYEQYAHQSPNTKSGLLHLPDLDMVVWAFPTDPLLPQLRAVTDPTLVRRHLPFDQFPVEFQNPSELATITPHVVHYRPECRCTIRYELQFCKTPQPLNVFGKTFRKGREEIFNRMLALWELSQESPRRITIAQPLHFDDTIKTIWQMGVSGVPLREVIGSGHTGTYVTSVAKGLATIQDSTLHSSETITIQDLLDELQKKTEKLSQVFPAGSETLHTMRDHWQAMAETRESPPSQLIHGDFHIDQLLAGQGRAIFFDFDEFAHGDPHQDLANFFVDLHYRGMSRDVLQPLAGQFIETYSRHVSWPVSPSWIEWHAGVQLVNKVYRAFVQRRPNFEQDFQCLQAFLEQGLVYRPEVRTVKETIGSSS